MVHGLAAIRTSSPPWPWAMPTRSSARGLGAGKDWNWSVGTEHTSNIGYFGLKRITITILP